LKKNELVRLSVVWSESGRKLDVSTSSLNCNTWNIYLGFSSQQYNTDCSVDELDFSTTFNVENKPRSFLAAV